MSDENVKHFEQLWEDAEVLSSKNHLSAEEVSNLVVELASEYKKISKVNIPKEILAALKKKKMGEIVYALAHLSALEGINVYESLQMEIQFNQEDAND